MKPARVIPARTSRSNVPRRPPRSLPPYDKAAPVMPACVELLDRRRSRRFDARALTGSLTTAGDDAPYGRLSACTLVNISYGGMCFRPPQALEVGTAARYRICLAALPREVFVTAEVRWVGAGASHGVAGAKFTESSAGWFGPED